MTGILNDKKTAAVNACRLCAPLGACLALRGIGNAMSLIHGSQGCATYIRRYIISHFREPMDIASSSFSEQSAIFGGEGNFRSAVENIVEKYNPELIGVVTSCLSETIGEDVAMYIKRLVLEKNGSRYPVIVHISSPAYEGSHMDGFQKTVKAVVESLSQKTVPSGKVNILPGFVTPADIRHLKEMLSDFRLSPVIFPDYSETLDAPIFDEYKTMPEGGTPVDEIRSMGDSAVTIELGTTAPENRSGGAYLENEFGVKKINVKYPVGIRLNDIFFGLLEKYSGNGTPEKYKLERGRLIDSYVDAHKYLFEKKAVIYGEGDFVISLAEFLLEIGMIPSLAATSGRSAEGIAGDGRFKKEMELIAGKDGDRIIVKEGIDFMEIEELAAALKPDIIIGSSKGYGMARRLGVPLIRLGFPIHDRIGAQRILSLGYRGTQSLFDQITNALLDQKQSGSKIGYGYL